MNPLTDVLPPTARKYVYAALFLAGLGLAAYKASEGDWVEFSATLLASLGFGTAASNTDAPIGLSINNMRRKKHDDRGALTIGRALVVVAIVAAAVLVAPDVANANSINNMR